MKNKILTALMIMLTTVVASAQTLQQTNQAPQSRGQNATSMSSDEKAKRMTERVNSVVQLSPEQYQKVMDLNKDFLAKQEVKRNITPTTPVAVGDFKAMNNEKEEKLKAILTPEQWKKWEEARGQQHMRTGMGEKNVPADKEVH